MYLSRLSFRNIDNCNTGQYDVTGMTFGDYVGYYNNGSSKFDYVAPTCTASHISISGSGSRANFVLFIKDENGTEIATMNNALSSQSHSINNLDVSGTKYITVGFKSGTAGVSWNDKITIVD